jgi:hypothetical protein
MAYISQVEKKELAPSIKAVLKKYGVKGSIGINHHSSLVVNLKEGKLDFIGEANKKNKATCERQGMPYHPITGDYYQANSYYAMEDEGNVGKFMGELVTAMKGDRWFDKSDIMTDYFHTAYYLDINVGKWDKPYVYTA